MTNKLKTLVALIGLLTGMASAFAATPFPFTLFTAASGTSPVFSENYLTASTSALTFSRSGQAMMYDSTGKLTYAPNNVLTYSNTFSNAAWTKTNVTVTGGQTDPLGGSNASTLTAGAANATCTQTTAAFTSNGQNTLWIKRKTGTGTIELSKPDGTYTTVSITGSWAQYTANYQGASATGAFNIRIVTNGDEIYVYSAAQSLVTYETSARSVDDVITTSAAYYGPRFEYGLASTTKTGWLIEGEARTNVVLWNRDLTNAAWTKTNVTAAKDQAGLAGVANSASSITATASNGTCLQAITLSSSQRLQSAFVKRITGSGTVEMTTDNGSTWTAITVTGSWTRVTIAAQTLTNPTVGFRIVTSGDAIAVDYVQNETGTFASSPIYTTSASVTRAAETVTGTTTLLGYNASAGTLIIEADAPTVDQLALIGGFDAGTYTNSLQMYKSNAFINAAGNLLVANNFDGAQTALNSTVTLNGGSAFRGGIRWNTGGGATGFAVSVNGGSPITGQVRTPTPTTFRLGVRSDGYPIMGHIRMVYNYNTDLGNTEFQAKTTVGAAP